ncbi:MAG: DUF2007 domain-containing protein [Treponema sp.]|jgi:hypothetical protein|nr:DUF2007 domain-containing protein [Treponema sp.]
MYIFIVIFLAIIIAIFALFRSKFKDKNGIKKDRNDNEKIINENDKIEIEKVFFEKIKDGEKAFKIMIIYSQLDLMLIKSLFHLEQIPYYVEFEYSSAIYPGTFIDSLANSNIYILEKDYDDAIKIIEEYKNKKEIENGVDGIEINYKK